MTGRLTRRDVLRLSTAGAVASAASALHVPPAAAAQQTLTIDTANPGHRVSPLLYGEFFEEINLEMRPAFLRFPGGNYVEGTSLDTRWDWKKTVGPIWERPGHDNSAWNYWSGDGLGLLECLRLAEDLGATPIIGVFAGLNLGGNLVPPAELGPYVQDALDVIEYAIGPVTSTWGARRAADGHPRPFRTPLIEIGNEDFLNNGTQSYNDYRYPMFFDAIKARYPQVTTVATTDAIVPRRSTLRGSGGVFAYTAPANSLTVITVARGRGGG